MANLGCLTANHKTFTFDFDFEEFCLTCIEYERDKYRAALSEIDERFKTKQSLHKDDCFAYQVASKALGST